MNVHRSWSFFLHAQMYGITGSTGSYYLNLSESWSSFTAGYFNPCLDGCPNNPGINQGKQAADELCDPSLKPCRIEMSQS